MYFNFWHEFQVYSDFLQREITYRVLVVREIELWTPDQLALANRVTAVLVIVDAALIAMALTLIYLFTR